ncbi:MAG: FAD-binding oxidoreductase [Alphaproteobacteria bacterium]|nr:FAD-binding oxidoreductase [Alphaproteobacteria bacterium]
MSAPVARTFHSLGFGESARGRWLVPDRLRFLDALPGVPGIPRGAGLSLAGAGFGEDVLALDMRRFDRILAFDPGAGTITVEAGITLGKLFRFLAPRGWQIAAQPGHPDITVGGCIAGNVHGKNPLAHGCFGRWVLELDLIHPDHGRLVLSADERADLLELTIGGFGLTGVIATATILLQPMPGGRMRVEPVPVASLEAAVETLIDRQGDADQLYSWHDMATSGRRGPGLVFHGRPLNGPRSALPLASYPALNPELWALPVGVMNRPGIAVVNLAQSLRWRRPRELGAAEAAFPFARLPYYFYLYGRKGFLEHQTLVPWAAAPAYLTSLRRLFDRHGVTPGLFVMKPFGGSPGLLRFEGEGLSVALEAAGGEQARTLFTELDALDADHGGRANLIKDARLPARAVAAQYPGLDEFRRRLAAFDPRRRMRSSLSRRLEL